MMTILMMMMINPFHHLSRLPEVQSRCLKKGKSSEFNSRDDGHIKIMDLSINIGQNGQKH